MAGPELYARQPLRSTPGEPPHWWINPPADPSWVNPVFSEWELTTASFSDEHAHDEYVYVLEGELHVESAGVRISATKGDMVRVPGGAPGIYSTPSYVRLLSVYAPNPDGIPVRQHGYEQTALEE